MSFLPRPFSPSKSFQSKRSSNNTPNTASGRNSDSLGSLNGSGVVSRNHDALEGEELIKKLLKKSKKGKADDLKLVLDAMFDLDNVLSEKTQERLADYLAHERVLHRMILLLTSEREDGSTQNAESLRELYKYRYVVSCFILYGPDKVRQAISKSEVLMIPLLKFITSEEPQNVIVLEYVARVLGSLLHDNPEETITHITYFAKGTFVPRLVNRIGSRAVSELLIRFVSEHGFFNQEELHFGPLNHFGVDTLCKAQLMKLLADRFIKAVEARVYLYDTACIVENCASCMTKISMRAWMGKETLDNAYNLGEIDDKIRDYLNFALDDLMIFKKTGLDALARMVDSITGSAMDKNSEWAFSAAWGVIVDTLAAIDRAKTSQMINIKVIAVQVNLKNLEHMIQKRIHLLAPILKIEKGPVGRKKFLVIELFSLCLRLGSTELIESIIDLNIHKTLIDFLLHYETNGLLQRMVRLAVQTSLKKDIKKCHKGWLVDVDLIDLILLTHQTLKKGSKRGYYDELMEIAVSVRDFLNRREALRKPIYVTEKQRKNFKNFCASSLNRYIDSREMPLVNRPAQQLELPQNEEVFDEDEGEALYIMTKLTEKFSGDDGFEEGSARNVNDRVQASKKDQEIG